MSSNLPTFALGALAPIFGLALALASCTSTGGPPSTSASQAALDLATVAAAAQAAIAALPPGDVSPAVEQDLATLQSAASSSATVLAGGTSAQNEMAAAEAILNALTPFASGNTGASIALASVEVLLPILATELGTQAPVGDVAYGAEALPQVSVAEARAKFGPGRSL